MPCEGGGAGAVQKGGAPCRRGVLCRKGGGARKVHAGSGYSAPLQRPPPPKRGIPLNPSPSRCTPTRRGTVRTDRTRGRGTGRSIPLHRGLQAHHVGLLFSRALRSSRGPGDAPQGPPGAVPRGRLPVEGPGGGSGDDDGTKTDRPGGSGGGRWAPLSGAQGQRGRQACTSPVGKAAMAELGRGEGGSRPDLPLASAKPATPKANLSPTEPRTGCSRFLLSSGCVWGRYYRAAHSTGLIPNKTRISCRTLAACLLQAVESPLDWAHFNTWSTWGMQGGRGV